VAPKAIERASGLANGGAGRFLSARPHRRAAEESHTRAKTIAEAQRCHFDARRSFESTSARVEVFARNAGGG